jgi:hypothetical protein
MDCQWWSSTPNVHHGLFLMFIITYLLYLSWVHGRNNFCVAYNWFRLCEVTVKLIVVFEYQLIVGPVNSNFNSNSRLVLNPPFSPMACECQTRAPKPEKSQKIQSSGFEPGTSGLTVGGYNHCTIGSVVLIQVTYFNSKNLIFLSHLAILIGLIELIIRFIFPSWFPY